MEELQRPLKILDVGTADGYLGAVLKQQGHYVVGVEKDEFLAKGAEPYYAKFYLADLETFDFPFRAEFDFIIFADVLEHLREPEVVLGRSLSCLNSTGQIIVSVPNIANLLIRIMLLFGKFDYQDRGILDRTHLRFYTLSSFNALLQNAACRVVDVVPTPLPVQLVFPWTQSPQCCASSRDTFRAGKTMENLTCLSVCRSSSALSGSPMVDGTLSGNLTGLVSSGRFLCVSPASVPQVREFARARAA